MEKKKFYISGSALKAPNEVIEGAEFKALEGGALEKKQQNVVQRPVFIRLDRRPHHTEAKQGPIEKLKESARLHDENKEKEKKESTSEEMKIFASSINGDGDTNGKSGLVNIGTPESLAERLASVGYQCLHYLAVQIALVLNTHSERVRALLLEGPSGCGKSFLAKSLARITGAELMCLSCYQGMLTQNLIESPSTLALANAMVGKGSGTAEELLNLGILSRAYLGSQDHPVILLIDELDKPDSAIDTFFLGPIQDARIWLESRPPIDAKVDNLLLIFTKNFNRTIDEALLRRCHPIKMTYLDSTLERKILSEHCNPQLVTNLVLIADRMRNSGGSYQFERPPAPEELLAAGLYVEKLLEWGMNDFGFIARNIWATIAKSEHDRAVLEHMLRYHPDFIDPLFPDGKNTPIDEIYKRLGRVVLDGIIEDPDKEQREQAWRALNYT
ncbi:MAG: AAA domain-containing protein [SAR324 cluster bacterium]|uniref:AAA domain-containing protein n=1 Tax=SAR324 cluster bacterium TaxID=2024889 RepID=A0A7X9IJJ5_9DELT|nr:AAA domain-containing protein [SAR324 cluster bacterium]